MPSPGARQRCRDSASSIAGSAASRPRACASAFRSDVVAARPDVVLIWGHVNNITQSNVANATAEQAEAVIKAAREDYLAMLQQARAAGIDVMLATEIPLAEPQGLVNDARAWLGRVRGKQSYAERVNVHVRELNDVRASAGRPRGSALARLREGVRPGRRRARSGVCGRRSQPCHCGGLQGVDRYYVQPNCATGRD